MVYTLPFAARGLKEKLRFIFRFWKRRFLNSINLNDKKIDKLLNN